MVNRYVELLFFERGGRRRCSSVCPHVLWSSFFLLVGRRRWCGHTISQGEGSEQGDALMPLLFAVGQHSASEAIQEDLQEGDVLLAYHDDIYTVRVSPIHATLQDHLYSYARIRIHGRKTQVWNRGGTRPSGCDVLEHIAQIINPNARVWRGPARIGGSSEWGPVWWCWQLKSEGAGLPKPGYSWPNLPRQSLVRKHLSFRSVPAVALGRYSRLCHSEGCCHFFARVEGCTWV